MNYYEELSVAQDASHEEIHHAYRVLARLFHPDNQSDPKLKSAAERQMIRLNAILAILGDPEKRRKYDQSLRTTLTVFKAAPLPPPTIKLYRYWPWILAFGILVGVGTWYMRSNESASPSADLSPAPSVTHSVPPPTPPLANMPRASEGPPPSEIQPPARQPARSKPPAFESFNPAKKHAKAEPVNRLPETSKPAEVTADQVRETSAPPIQPPQAARDTPPQPQGTPGQQAGPTFVGRWLYAPAVHDPRTPGMYPPEFIEFFLSEEQGVLSGKYWARYRIPDKPVSPEVQFRVSGAPQGDNATTLKWVAEDGANGQLKMVLRGSNSLEVTWWTTAFGRQTALTSGTAVLMRQQVR
jgi:curved DNA-binding protein CbpA